MRISVILLTLILSSNCLSYKLRRDLRTVRQYCEKICTGCGGKASLRLDVCICKDDEQSTGLDKCFEKARNKLDFLGIKWEVPRKTIEKRSIYSPNHPSPFDHDIYFKRGRKTLIKRSDGSLKKGPAKTQIMGLQWGLQPKQVSPKGKSRQRRSFDRFKLIFGPSRFSDNTFQPVENYQANLGAPFKLLLAGSEPTNLNGNSPYGILNKQQPTILIDNNKPTEWIDDDDDEEDEDDSSSEEFMDYEYSQGCEDGFRIERYGIPQAKEYKLITQVKQVEPQTNEQDVRSLWVSVLPEIYNEHFYRPQNYPCNYETMHGLSENIYSKT